jgi:hypothetical protein
MTPEDVLKKLEAMVSLLIALKFTEIGYRGRYLDDAQLYVRLSE